MRSSKYAILLVGCLAASAYAADPQPEDQTPPAPQAQQQQPALPEHQNRNRFFEEGRRGFGYRPITVEMRKGAYLGVSTSPASPVLQRQLGLPEGMGLVIEFIAPKSPAEEAGLRQYDVMQKLGDQLLINTEQLSVLVRSYKPGDEVKITVLRDGKPQTLTVKLAEHELEPLTPFGYWAGPNQFQDFPMPQAPPRTARPPAPGFGPRWGLRSGSTITWFDGDRNYTVSMRDGQQTITVKDRNDKVIYEGPIQTKEQRNRLPTDIKDKVDRMMKSGLLPPASNQPAPENGKPEDPTRPEPPAEKL